MSYQSAWLLAAALLLSPAAPAQVWNTPTATPIAPSEGTKAIGAVSRETIKRAGVAFDPTQSRGVFIGVNVYTARLGVKPANLKACVNDAIDLAAAFMDLGLITGPGITLLLSGEPTKPASQQTLARLVDAGAILSHEANRDKIDDAIRGAADEAGADGMLFLTWSAHGFEANGVQYLTPANFTSSTETPSNVELESQGLSEAALAAIFKASKAQRGLLLFDACRETKSTADGVAQLRDASTGMVTLYAVNSGELAKDGTRNGAFTTKVLAALVDDPPPDHLKADSHGHVTVGTLLEYLGTAARIEDPKILGMPLREHPRQRSVAAAREAAAAQFREAKKLEIDVPSEDRELEAISVEALERALIGPVGASLVTEANFWLSTTEKRSEVRQREGFANKWRELMSGSQGTPTPPSLPVPLPDSLAGLAYSPPASGAILTRSVGGGRVVGYSTVEITQGLYRRVMGKLPGDLPAFLTDDSLPVVMVSYNDAVDFCAKASGGGIRLRLPSVAEWKSLCTTPPTAVGGTMAPSPEALKERLRQAAARTELIPAGGVWEWCTPDGGVANGQAMIMGGSVLIDSKDPCALVRPMDVAKRDYLTGFRVVIEQGP